MKSDEEAKEVAAFERLPELVANDADLLRIGRYMTVDFMVEIGSVPFYLSVERGRLVTLEKGPLLMRPWTFAVRGTAEAWNRFWQPIPEPGWHDIFALAKRGVAGMEGDLHPFMANLQYIKNLLAAPRRIFKES
jgi:hypothetical protein